MANSQEQPTPERSEYSPSRARRIARAAGKIAVMAPLRVAIGAGVILGYGACLTGVIAIPALAVVGVVNTYSWTADKIDHGRVDRRNIEKRVTDVSGWDVVEAVCDKKLAEEQRGVKIGSHLETIHSDDGSSNSYRIISISLSKTACGNVINYMHHPNDPKPIQEAKDPLSNMVFQIDSVAGQAAKDEKLHPTNDRPTGICNTLQYYVKFMTGAGTNPDTATAVAATLANDWRTQLSPGCTQNGPDDLHLSDAASRALPLSN
ncbi:MAG TPA: hypothetical protein VMR45_06340 [Patescibacteria group bacterium]|nr:hypothetical protein [Patescibacteria group bacterium]